MATIDHASITKPSPIVEDRRSSMWALSASSWARTRPMPSLDR
jgi:hypothetical protein